MKLESLYIKEYRVLKELKIDFGRGNNSALNPQSGYTLDFLVGVNGTGKTTVLQFLGRLLVALYEQDTFPIPFELIYTLTGLEKGNERKITVTNIPSETNADQGDVTDIGSDRFYFREGEGKLQRGRLPNTLLPELVVVYTTGSEREWLAALQPTSIPQSDETEPERQPDQPSVEQPGHRPNLAIFSNEDAPNPTNVLFIQSYHSSLVALCGLLAAEQSSQLRRNENAAVQSVLNPVLEALRLELLGVFSLPFRSQPN